MFAILKDYLLTGGQCRYILSPPLYRTRGFGVGLRKGEEYTEQFERMYLVGNVSSADAFTKADVLLF